MSWYGSESVSTVVNGLMKMSTAADSGRRTPKSIDVEHEGIINGPPGYWIDQRPFLRHVDAMSGNRADGTVTRREMRRFVESMNSGSRKISQREHSAIQDAISGMAVLSPALLKQGNPTGGGLAPE